MRRPDAATHGDTMTCFAVFPSDKLSKNNGYNGRCPGFGGKKKAIAEICMKD